MTANTAIAAIDPNAETLALVKQAQTAYAAGQDRQWAGLLWTAMEKALRELAQSRGIPEANNTVILKQLDKLAVGPSDEYFSSAIGSLLMLRTHYQLGVLESYWWEDLHTDAVAFITLCHNAAAPGNTANLKPTLPSPKPPPDSIPMATHPKIEIDPQAETMALVKQAQAAYAAGQDRQWAGLLWTAMEKAIRELAHSRGISGDDNVATLKRLDQLDVRPRDGYFSASLSSLIMLRTHYQLGVLESYWWEDLHADAVAFITLCHDAVA